jgi:hypothetical protein
MSGLSGEASPIAIPTEKEFLEAQLKELNDQIAALKQSKVYPTAI